MSNGFIRNLLVVVSLTACLGCSVASGDHAEQADDSDRSTQSLSGACSTAIDACIVGGGGGGCATKFCVGDCTGAVASCLRGGGGKACVNRCSGAAACTPQDEWTEIWTWECGIPYGAGMDNSATPGKARATCTRECDGQMDHCHVWHSENGLPVCTLGVPLDDNQNPL